MHLERLCFCLTIWAVSWAQDVVVSQPNSIEINEDESVTLSCSYNSSSKTRVGSYRWTKDWNMEVKNATSEFKGRVARASDDDFLKERRADIQIRDLRYYDSGVYHCHVKLTGLLEVSGNGTELHVRRASPKEAGKSEENTIAYWLGAGLGSALVLSVTTSLLLLYCRKKRDHQRKASRPAQRSQAEAEPSYAQLTLKEGRSPRLQSGKVTYAAVHPAQADLSYAELTIKDVKDPVAERKGHLCCC